MYDLFIKLVLVGLISCVSRTSATTLTITTSTTGNDYAALLNQTRRYESTHPDINVVFQPYSSSSSSKREFIENTYWDEKDAGIDIAFMDVVWMGDWAEHLVNLMPFANGAELEHIPDIIENNSPNGKLVAMPAWVDFGMLYYRTDLLQKYKYTDDGTTTGVPTPPATYAELEEMSKTIQDGERQQTGNAKFAGWVWGGNKDEGYTCNLMEWLSGFGAGNVVELDAEVSINNEKAANALKTMQDWVGTISPYNQAELNTQSSKDMWLAGNAAFHRNWPYLIGLSHKTSGLVGKFSVAPLPVESNQPARGALGGWGVGVSKYSKNRIAAIEFVMFLTSESEQMNRAKWFNYIPTRSALLTDEKSAEMCSTGLEPSICTIKSPAMVPRPASQTSPFYGQVSKAMQAHLHPIINGAPVAAALQDLECEIYTILSRRLDAPEQCIASNHITESSFGGMTGLACFCIVALLVLAVLVHCKGHTPVFKKSSVKFGYCMILGGIICCLIVILKGLDSNMVDDTTIRNICLAEPWLFSLGFVLIFGSFAVKLLRIYRIFDLKNLRKKKKTSDMDLMSQLGGLLAIEAFVNLLWISIAPQHVEMEFISDGTEFRTVCTGDDYNFWLAIHFVSKGALMAGTSFMAFKTKDVVDSFNESKMVGFAVYNVIIVAAIFTPLVVGGVIDDVNLMYVILSIGILLASVSSLAIFFIPKVIIAYFQPEKNTASTGTASGLKRMTRTNGGNRSSVGNRLMREAHSGIHSGQLEKIVQNQSHKIDCLVKMMGGMKEELAAIRTAVEPKQKICFRVGEDSPPVGERKVNDSKSEVTGNELSPLRA